jgi:adenosine deaminase
MTLALDDWIVHIPKVELHVHLEGSVQPETLLELADRHNVELPATDVAGLLEWYRFRDFDHFLDIYRKISISLRTIDDIELITRQFLQGQAAQNIRYSEVTFTPYSQYFYNQLGFHEQIDAVNRARTWAELELGVRMGIIVDIPRMVTPEEGDRVASWVLERYGDGIIALGLGGPEIGHPPEKFARSFERALAAGIPCILHAGETAGPESIWSALRVANSRRIGHGVRAVEDPDLVTYLREKQIPLEVCPTSNLCLKVYPSYAQHSLPELIKAGVYVTINSDDPPMFNTTLTNEFQVGVREWGWDRELIRKLILNAVDVSLLPEVEQVIMRKSFEEEFVKLQ